jgi:hypothetical protein
MLSTAKIVFELDLLGGQNADFKLGLGVTGVAHAAGDAPAVVNSGILPPAKQERVSRFADGLQRRATARMVPSTQCW